MTTMRNTRSLGLLNGWASRIVQASRAVTLTGWAGVLAVSGWALMWAAALKLVLFVPVSAAVLMFVSGLALIPLAARPAVRSP